MSKGQKYDPVYMAAWRKRNKAKIRAYQKAYDDRHPGRRKAVTDAWIAANRDAINAKARADYAKAQPKRAGKARQRYAARQEHFVEKMRERVAHDPALYLWRRAKDRAEKTGLPFNIAPSDILVPVFCPVLGIKLSRGRGGFHPASPTLDKIDNCRGYVKGNVVVVSWRANRLKSDATVSELRAIVSFYEKLL